MSDQIDDLIPRIYEAALEPECWPEVLRNVSELTGDSVALLCHEPLTRLFDEPRPLTPGIGERWTHNYDRSVLERSSPSCWTVAGNPLVAATTYAPVGAVFDRRQFLDDDAYMRSPAVQAMALSQDLFHLVLSTPHRQDDTVSAFTLAQTRRGGPIEGELLERFSRLVPHVGIAMRVHARLHRLSSEAQELRAVLDRLGVATVLVDDQCRVRYANAEAERILRAGDGLTLARGRLMPAAAAARRRLEALVGHTRAPERHDADFEGDHVVVPRPSGGPAYGLFVAPAVGSGASGWAPGAGAMVFITDPAHERASLTVEWLRRQFGLTRAEAGVARLIARGRGLPSVAQDLGITLNTAKTHLKAIYAKTGTDRQARLTRLILQSAPPSGRPA